MDFVRVPLTTIRSITILAQAMPALRRPAAVKDIRRPAAAAAVAAAGHPPVSSDFFLDASCDFCRYGMVKKFDTLKDCLNYIEKSVARNQMITTAHCRCPRHSLIYRISNDDPRDYHLMDAIHESYERHVEKQESRRIAEMDAEL